MMLGLTRVESLRIGGCEELTSLCQNKWGLLAHMGSLKDLMISNCHHFVSLAAEDDEEEQQQLGKPFSINHLNLSSTRCKLSKASRVFTSLQKLQIEKCPKLVSFSAESLPVTLKRLVIRYCENLHYLLNKGKDMNFRKTSCLEDLNIEWCPSLISLSSSCELPSRLKNLHIEYCSKLASLSSRANLPAGLQQLHINNCPELKSISGELPIQLQTLQIWCCSKLTALSPSSMLPEGLKHLQISNGPELKSVAQINSCLEYIGLIGCKNIQSLPQGLDRVSHLKEIVLIYCPRLSFSESWLPSSCLKVLHIDACEKFIALPNNFQNLNSLEELEMSDCPLPAEGFPVNLRSLGILQHKTCTPLKEWGLDKLTRLTQLTIEGEYDGMVSFPPEEAVMMLPSSLAQLTIKGFASLKSLSSSGFRKLTSLKYLSIMDCHKLASLPTKDSLPLLFRLHLDDCPLLRPQCKINGQEWSKIAHIPYIRLDDELVRAKD